MGDIFPLFGGLFAISFFMWGNFYYIFLPSGGIFVIFLQGGGVFFVFMGAFYGLSRPHAKTFVGAHGGGGLTIEIRLEENRQINCQNKGKKIPNPKI